jgi:Raf kinase inhibitor-like YbhB/YbcL family protein
MTRGRTRSVVAVAAVTAWSAIVTGQNAPAKLTVTSTVIKEGQPIPKDYTGDGKDMSPPLAWQGAPSATKQFAVLVDDPDAPMPVPFVHWTIYKIPAQAKGLPEAVPRDATLSKPAAVAGALQGLTDFDATGYGGPAPPPGSVHHYHFRVYALDQALDLKPGIDKNALMAALKGHIIAQGELIGTYER